MAPNLQQVSRPPTEDYQMFIYGLKCIFCHHALENLGIQNGVMSTKCTHCGHISKPKARQIPQNTFYSKFANKNIQVQYNAKATKW